MKYKVGDRVRIKSIDWYNENKDADNYVHCGDRVFDNYMSVFCGSVITIGEVSPYGYDIREDMHCRVWTDEMIEGLVEEKFGTALNSLELKSNANCITQNEVDVIEKAKKYWDSIKDAWICPEGYQFKDENGNIINARKIVLEKKQREYPKSYEECIGKLPINWDGKVEGYKCDLLTTFQKLLICRDVYWKIAGEEMGLGKPWEPDYDSGVNKYGIICMNGVVQKSNPTTNWERHLNKVLDFPTEEMRDAFKENFDPDIEICKEFL